MKKSYIPEISKKENKKKPNLLKKMIENLNYNKKIIFL
jgi:hypothetical protein